jgi:D-alanine-D-alanine ligase
MRIGITYDLKAEEGAQPLQSGEIPDDFQEEFDSPATIEAIAEVLRGLGHEVEKLGDGRELLKRLLASPPEFVFNIAEGHGVSRSREARVPAVLEMLDIPYSGSDPLTLAATLDKDCAKKLVAANGIAVPAGVVARSEELLQIANCKLQIANWEDGRSLPEEPGLSSICNLQFAICNLQFPLIAKPVFEGSSKGIRNKCLVERPEDLPSVIRSLLEDYKQPVLVEEFIQGDELTVGVIGNAPPRILGIMRVVPVQPTQRFVYSLEVKRDFRRLVRYECPPCLPSSVIAAVEKAALTVYQTLGCRDVARIDFRLRDGIPYFLEANPLPGLNTESSDLVILARSCGWSYVQLIETILQAALDRQPRTTAGTLSAVPN